MPRPKRTTPRRLPPDQERAARAVKAAIRAGTLTRPTACERCAATGPKARVCYHHWCGYEGEAATLVVALCASCHVRTHRGDFPEVRTGRIRDDARDAQIIHWRDAAAVDAIEAGRTFARNVTNARFEQIRLDLIATGLGSLRDGITRWREESGIARAKWRLAEQARREAEAARWRDHRAAWERKTAAEVREFAEALRAHGSPRAAQHALGRRVSMQVRRLAREEMARAV